MRHLDQPSRLPTVGDNHGFLLEMLVLLGSILLIVRFRPQLEAMATQPGAALANLNALEQTLIQDVLAVIPVLVGSVIVILVGVVLIRRWWTGPIRVPRGARGRGACLRVGRYRGSRWHYTLPRDATFDHALILGRTRSGKSQHAVSLAVQDLDRGDCALVLIDPHDELCRSFVAAGFDALQHRAVTWLSFADGASIPGFDLLERGLEESPSAVAERLGDLIDWLFFAGESTDHERLSNNLRVAAWACASLGRSLLDCRLFLTDPQFRAAVRLQLTDPYLLEALREFEETLRHDPSFAQSAVNRLANLSDNEALRKIVGQSTTFQLDDILDHQGVLLVSLDEAVLGEKGVYLLAGMLLHRIAGHLKRRQKDDGFHHNPKVRIVLDEAQRYQVGLLQGMVGELAGRGASLTLITQGVTQIADPRMRSFLLNNVSTYSVFTIADQEAELIARELFETRANRVGLVDERGRPSHVLAIPEQVAEQKRLLTRQERREFVARARGREPGFCQSFEVCPKVGSGVVEAFRRRCAVQAGHPKDDVERMLRDRLEKGRADVNQTLSASGKDASREAHAMPHVRSKKSGFAETHLRDATSSLQLPLKGLEPKP